MIVKRKPLVSVIVPAFNAEDFVDETLKSIVKQTYKNIEIIVIDNGSQDYTYEVVQTYRSKVRYFYLQNSGGCAVPRNIGIGKCCWFSRVMADFF